MRNRAPLPERLLRIAVAGLVLASPVVAPLLHAGEESAGPSYTSHGDPGSSFRHDHAVCVQLQSSTPRPAAPPVAPAAATRVTSHPIRPVAVPCDLAWRARPRARSPPSRHT